MEKSYLFLIVLLALSVSAQANLIPNGDFQTVLGPDGLPYTLPDGSYFNICTGIVKGTYPPVAVQLPGWICAEGSNDNADVMQGAGWGGPNGSGDLAFLAFGSWGGPTYIETSAPLSLPVRGQGVEYELSCDVYHGGGPVVLELRVDGVALTPDNESTPPLADNTWVVFTRTYSNIPAGDVTVLVGTRDDAGTGWTGNRVSIDNVWLASVPGIMRFDLADFAVFAGNWLRTNCTEANQWCDDTDLNNDGSVDVSDLAEFAAYWLNSGPDQY